MRTYKVIVYEEYFCFHGFLFVYWCINCYCGSFLKPVTSFIFPVTCVEWGRGSPNNTYIMVKKKQYLYHNMLCIQLYFTITRNLYKYILLYFFSV